MMEFILTMIKLADEAHKFTQPWAYFIVVSRNSMKPLLQKQPRVSSLCWIFKIKCKERREAHIHCFQKRLALEYCVRHQHHTLINIEDVLPKEKYLRLPGYSLLKTRVLSFFSI